MEKRHFKNPEPDASINESKIFTEIKWSSILFSPKHVGMNCMNKNDYTKKHLSTWSNKDQTKQTKFQQIINTEHISPRNNCFDKKSNI